MTKKDVLILTSDPELSATAELCGEELEACFQTAAKTDEIGLLLAAHLSEVCAVIIDFDTVDLASAWVAGLESLDRKIPMIGVSRFHPRFLPDARRLPGIDHWLRKIVTMEEIVDALIPFCVGRARPFRLAESVIDFNESVEERESSSFAVLAP
jgi:hypothetical protein